MWKALKRERIDILHCWDVLGLPARLMGKLAPDFDIIAVPSVKEGFPMVTLEAMSMSKAIAATRIPGIIEQISDRREGILVPPKNPRAIAKAVIELHHDKQLALELGAGARKKAASLLKPGGLICLRFPNGDLHIRVHRLAQKLGLEKRVGRFLVFHEYPLTRKFMARLLSDCGFGQIDLYNSPLSEGDPNRLFSHSRLTEIIKKTASAITNGLERATFGKLLAGPSPEVLAIRKP